MSPPPASTTEPSASSLRDSITAIVGDDSARKVAVERDLAFMTLPGADGEAARANLAEMIRQGLNAQAQWAGSNQGTKRGEEAYKELEKHPATLEAYKILTAGTSADPLADLKAAYVSGSGGAIAHIAKGVKNLSDNAGNALDVAVEKLLPEAERKDIAAAYGADAKLAERYAAMAVVGNRSDATPLEKEMGTKATAALTELTRKDVNKIDSKAPKPSDYDHVGPKDGGTAAYNNLATKHGDALTAIEHLAGKEDTAEGQKAKATGMEAKTLVDTDLLSAFAGDQNASARFNSSVAAGVVADMGAALKAAGLRSPMTPTTSPSSPPAGPSGPRGPATREVP